MLKTISWYISKADPEDLLARGLIILSKQPPIISRFQAFQTWREDEIDKLG